MRAAAVKVMRWWAWPASLPRHARRRDHLGNPPGDQARNEQTGVLTQTLLQNIQVLSAARTSEGREGKPHPVQVVNVLVTPEQAEP